MRNATNALKARMAQEVTTLCRVFSLQLKNGQTYYYTDRYSPVYDTGAIYWPGCDCSAVRGAEDGSQGNATLTILYDFGGQLTEAQTRAGQLDGATFTVQVMDYEMPEAGKMLLMEGRVSSVNTSDQFAVNLDVTPYTIGSLVVGENYSQRCRNVFGDDRCKVDKNAGAAEFSVTSVDPTGVSFRIDLPIDREEPRTEYISGSTDYTDTSAPIEFVVPDVDIINFELISAGGGAGESAIIQGPNYYNGNPYFIVERGENGENATVAKIGRASGQQDVAFCWGGTAGTGTYSDGQAPDYTFEEINVGPLFGALPTARDLVFTPFGGMEGGKGQANIQVEGGLILNMQFPQLATASTAGRNATKGHKLTFTLPVGVEGGLVVGETLYITVSKAGAGGGSTGGRPGTDGTDGVTKLSYAGNQTIEAGNYVIGTVEWLTGQNVGMLSSISTNSEGGVTLSAPTRAPIRVGDRGRVQPGCTNYADMCENRYDNLKNMQAEPVVPQGMSTAPTPDTTTIADPARPPPTTEVNTGGFSGGWYASAPSA